MNPGCFIKQLVQTAGRFLQRFSHAAIAASSHNHGFGSVIVSGFTSLLEHWVGGTSRPVQLVFWG
jgi:hypothetical protein